MYSTFSYANGRFVDTQELSFPVETDILGTLRGARVFTSCRTVKNRVFHLDDHLNRVTQNAKDLGLRVELTHSEITRAIVETLLRNRHLNQDLLLLIILSGGTADASGMVASGPALLYIKVSPLTEPSPEWVASGVALALFAHQRPFAHIKVLNYVGSLMAHQTVVKEYNAYAPLFVTETGDPEWLEGSTFNVFAVQKGVLITPPLDGQILNGVTRSIILKLAEENGIAVQERPVLVSEIPTLDECFITSTTRGALPVTRIDQTQIGAGVPGPVTQTLIKAYTQYVSHY
jgi:branched-chain amino acid aminotransferase